MLVNATSEKNFIHHLDVYQGGNTGIAFMVEEARSLATNQNAVVNTIMSNGLSNNPDGMREACMDNNT